MDKFNLHSKLALEHMPDINPFRSPHNPINKNNNNNNNTRDTGDGPETELDLYQAQCSSNEEGSGSGSFLNPAKKLGHLDNMSRLIEDSLSAVSGTGSRMQCDMAMTLFFMHSTYSPRRLTEELGWEPVPREARGAGGAGGGDEAPTCTWYDAFEDLLAVSSGLEMRDRRPPSSASQFPETIKEYDTSARLPFLYGTTKEAAYGSACFSRMERNLSSLAYLPTWYSPRTMEDWVRLRQREANGGGWRSRVMRARAEASLLEEAGKAVAKEHMELEAVGRASLRTQRGAEVGIEAYFERAKRGEVKEDVASMLMRAAAKIRRREGRSEDRNAHDLEQIAKVVVVSRGKVTKVTEDDGSGLVRETAVNALAETSGRFGFRGTHTLTVWRDPATGHVVKLSEPKIEMKLGKKGIVFVGKPNWKRTVSPEVAAAGVDKSDKNHGQEGGATESKYKKWWFWK
ncbi:hypothetical protein QBC44DRAFT_72538 [Cladorrhinum sp. PSN332]|nr:hypothetical protein QBC44DRAFT_72538 [Cladorrhinum sp. PSN332]